MPLALLIAALSALPAEQPDLRAVMARAGAYVTKYQPDFSLLVADERCVQNVTAATEGEARGAKRTLTGTATYTNFRRFETEVRLLGVK